MTAALLAILGVGLSMPALILGGGGTIGLLAFAFVRKWPRSVLTSVAVAAAVYLAAGVVWQAADRSCREKFDARVAAAVKERVAFFESALTEARVRNHAGAIEIERLREQAAAPDNDDRDLSACLATEEEEKRYAPLIPRR